MRSLHEKLLGQKGSFERLAEQLKEKSAQLRESTEKLEAEEDTVCRSFLHMETGRAEGLLKSSRRRAGELAGLLQEMEKTAESLKEQQAVLRRKRKGTGCL